MAKYLGNYKRDEKSPTGFQKTSKVVWGTPAQITIARLDRICPQCSATTRNGLKIDKAGRWGHCEQCGFSWDFGCLGEEVPNAI